MGGQQLRKDSEVCEYAPVAFSLSVVAATSKETGELDEQVRMVATDGSDRSSRAINAGAELVKSVGGTLTIATIGAERFSDEQKEFARVEGDLADAAETFARQILNDAEQRARQAGIAACILDLAWGEPAQTIIEIIWREKIDAVVVGRRGRG